MKLNPSTNCGCCGGGGFTVCGCTGVPGTLTFTDSILGSCTLTRRGSPFFDWLGFLTISYPGATLPCGSCPPQTLSIGVVFKQAGTNCQVQLSWDDNTFPPPCWSDATAGGGGLLGFGGIMTATCSPFHATGGITITPGSSCFGQLIYGSSTASPTWTITP